MTLDKRTDAPADRLLEVRNVQTHLHTEAGIVRAVDGVSLELDREKVVGVVGESGCGKSMLALSVLQLVPHPGRIVGGSIRYYGEQGEAPVDITTLPPDGPRMRGIRGEQIAMVFQEPMTSLSPIYTIGEQITETLHLHRKLSKREARAAALELLRKVGMPAPAQRLDEYPFRLSGGMRQRALIAIALSCGPKLLIADEPTTALDVTVQAQILRLLKTLQRETRMAILFISHDLGVIARMADDVIVMYLGTVVERGAVREIFRRPQHPYTVGLLNSVPRLGSSRALVPVRGTVPSPFDVPEGCRFRDRCPFAMDRCREDPPEFEVGGGHTSKCWLNEGGMVRDHRLVPDLYDPTPAPRKGNHGSAGSARDARA